MIIQNHNEFAAFILTHGRPDNVLTYDSLKKSGYTGRIVLIIDNEDKHKQQYHDKYGNEVYEFNKTEYAKTIDKGDNFPGNGTAMFARNYCWEVARQLGLKYFVQLDDDYTRYSYKYGSNYEFVGTKAINNIRNMDLAFQICLDFLINSNAYSVAFAQEGDFVRGGADKPKITRKCMNSWFCCTDKPIDFTMRMNDDVTTYVRHGSYGKLFFTIYQLALAQAPTQAVSGGMTEMYAKSGTYQKTFYTILSNPSSVKISTFGMGKNMRIHHRVDWNKTVPKIIRQEHKK